MLNSYTRREAENEQALDERTLHDLNVHLREVVRELDIFFDAVEALKAMGRDDITMEGAIVQRVKVAHDRATKAFNTAQYLWEDEA